MATLADDPSDGGESGPPAAVDEPASEGSRRHRADAVRNRERLLAAADAVFSERGLDVGVGEIAQRAGVGRGTLFRNFPCKQDLIAAIVVERMRDAARAGRELLRGGDGKAVFGYIAEIAGRQQGDRALFEAVADTFLANPEIKAAHAEVIETLDALLDRAKHDGLVREDIGALDVMIMLKGACAAATAFGARSDMLERHLDLVLAAISTPSHPQSLRGSAPTLADLQAPASQAGVAPIPPR